MRPLFNLLLVLLVFTVHGQTISTIAGKVPPPANTFDGDGGPAINAHLGYLYQGSVAFDAAGNMYITEVFNNRITKVDAAGIITTIAGNGTLGYTGDGGPAINATLYHPNAIVVDNAGNIIFADQQFQILRQIDPTGIITTISAPGAGACAGEGVPLSQAVFNEIYALKKDNAGNIYLSDGGCMTVRKISTSRIVTTIAGNGSYGFSGDGGPATSAQLFFPGTVGLDNAGNIYIPDCDNHRVRKVDPSGIITTIAGTGVEGVGTSGISGDGGPATAATIGFPISVCVDNTGNLYVAQDNCYVVRKIDPAGIITNYAGTGIHGYAGDGGPANLAQFSEIANMDQDAAGNFYVVDVDNQVIRKITNCVAATFTLQPAAVSLCSNSSATLNVTTSNAGSLQWQINTGTGWNNISDNSTYSGSTSGTLAITTPDAAMNNAQYRCMAGNTCGNSYSSPALLSVQAAATPSISISTSGPPACVGSPVTLSALTQNSGATPIYQWTKNGAATGTNTPDYTDDDAKTGDLIQCTLTSDQTCLTNPTAASNTLSVKLNPLPANFLPPDTTMCVSASVQITAQSGYANYLWSNNSAGRSINITQPGLYWLQVTDNNHCVGLDTIIIAQKDCLDGFFIPTAFTPNNDGRNDNFAPVVRGNITHYQFSIFNRQGMIVFQTTNPTQTWDGAIDGKIQPAGTYVWICTYQFAGSPIVEKKGTVMLIR